MGWFKKSDDDKLDRYTELSQQLAGYGHGLHDADPFQGEDSQAAEEYVELYHELKDTHDVPFVGPRWWKLVG